MSNTPDKSKKPDGFSSSLGFLFAAIASAVGLSNIWRMSAEAAQNGGGIYLFCYFFCVIVIGYPILLGELAFGRSRQKGVYESYLDQGRWKWVGLFGAVACFLTFCFYNIVAGWVVGYFYKLGNGELGALQGQDMGAYENFFSALKGNYKLNLACTLFMAIAAVLINQAGVSGGIERCAKVLMPLFILMMFGLIAYSLTLDGAFNGLSFYLWPSLSKVSLGGMASAMSQALMSLSIGIGAMITYGAYVGKEQNLKKSAMMIAGGDTLVAFCAGLFLFAFLGATGGVSADGAKVKPGAGLAFEALPHALLQNLSPMAAKIILGAFFLLLMFAAITSSIALLEVPVKYLESCTGISRKVSLWIFGLASYVVSTICIFSDARVGIFENFPGGKDTLHDYYINFVVKILLPLSTFLFSLFIAFKWKVESIFEEDTESKGSKKWFVTYVTISLKYLVPLLSGFTFFYSLYDLFGSTV